MKKSRVKNKNNHNISSLCSSPISCKKKKYKKPNIECIGILSTKTLFIGGSSGGVE